MDIQIRHVGGALLSIVVAGFLLVEPVAAEAPTQAPIRDPDHRFSKRVQSWTELKRQNIVMQKRDYSCGAAALATIVRYYWSDPVDEEVFLNTLSTLLTREEAIDRVENGLAMSDLRRAAVKTGYQAIVGKLTIEKLIEAKVPLVVGITVDGHDHFVVYRGTDGYHVYLADPIRGNVRVPISVFRKQWQKNTVLAVHKPGHEVKDVSPLTVSESEIALGKLNKQLIRSMDTRRRPPAVR